MQNVFDSFIVKKLIAHRGLFNYTDAPEDSLRAFSRAIESGYAIELDVHLISDGTLIVFHDDSLDRVSKKQGNIFDLKKSDLENIKLGESDQTIPTMEEVLKLIDGKVPVLIEIKSYLKNHVLEEKLYNLLKKYKGEFAIESFNPLSVAWFAKNAPNILRGQLACLYKKEDFKVISPLKRMLLKTMWTNKLSKPHFIAYNYQDLPNKYINKFKHLPIIAYTINNQKSYDKIKPFVDNVIFQDFIPIENNSVAKTYESKRIVNVKVKK